MTSGLDRRGGTGLSERARHGDRDAVPGMVDFAVNVRGGPPDFVLDAVRSGLADLARYPTVEDEQRAIAAIAAAHRRDPDEVVLLSGAADGFEMLPRLLPRHAALVQPSFTEPELVLAAAGIRITDVVLRPPWELHAGTGIPDDADLVVIGNPTNPTSVLHSRAAIEALARPGRLIVVDEAFADLTLDGQGNREPQSFASVRRPDVIVIRSVTKTFGLAGLRAGYLLGDRSVLARLCAGRRPWALSTPALAALAACVGELGEDHCAQQARAVAVERDHLRAELERIGLPVATTPNAPFVLVEADDALALKAGLAQRGIAVRSCANFVGLGPRYLRLAVRPAAQVRQLVTAIESVRTEIGDG